MALLLNKEEKIQFEKDYFSMTTDELCEKYHISAMPIMETAKRLGIWKENLRRKIDTRLRSQRRDYV